MKSVHMYPRLLSFSHSLSLSLCYLKLHPCSPLSKKQQQNTQTKNQNKYNASPPPCIKPKNSCLLCLSLPTDALAPVYCVPRYLPMLSYFADCTPCIKPKSSCLLCPSLPTNALIFCRLHTLWQCSSANRIHDSRAERQARQHLASLTFLHGFFFGGTGNWESLINKFPLWIWRPLSASRLQ